MAGVESGWDERGRSKVGDTGHFSKFNQESQWL